MFFGTVDGCPHHQKVAGAAGFRTIHHPRGRFVSLPAIHTPWAWIDPHLGMSLWTTRPSCGRIGAGRELYTADRVYPPLTPGTCPQSDAALELGGRAPSTQSTGPTAVAVLLFEEISKTKTG